MFLSYVLFIPNVEPKRRQLERVSLNKRGSVVSLLSTTISHRNNTDKSKLRVLISILGRSTPVELDFDKVKDHSDSN